MLKRKCIVAASLLGLLALAASPALGDFDPSPFHNSTEDYYDSGGTNVVCSAGCSSFVVGDITGDVRWEVKEKGWYDFDGGQTKISYTVFNDSYLDPITSLHVPTNGLVPVFLDAPTNWTAAYNAVSGKIEWEANSAADGIPIFESLDTMIVIYDGIKPIVFEPYVMVDLTNLISGARTEHTSAGWVVSTVPVPGAVVLGVIGLGIVGWLKRRFA